MWTCLTCLSVVPSLLGSVVLSRPPVIDVPRVAELQALRQQRRELAHRKRRIICNNDGNEPVYFCSAATPEEMLRVRIAGLENSHVDTVFYCTWSSGFGLFTHNTKVGEVLTSREGILEKNITADLIAQGTDPLRIVVDYCKQRGIEVFWSMRMNDVHDGEYDEIVPRWKREHPECLFGSKEKKPTGVWDGRVWSGVDYGCREVRERAFRFMEEVCRNYDVDGIEMDFFRHPVYFRCHAWGQPCGQEQRDQMTRLVRRVRVMTEQVGLRRGRPILVAVRVPDAVGYCEAIGLDITRWLQEGLVDILIPSDYFQLSPWEESVSLGHRYGVPVYPCLSESRIAGEAGARRNQLEVYRARAMNVWRSGADGVYTFNLFWPPNHQVWRELGDPEVLKKLDKTYYVAYRGFRYADVYLPGGSRFIKIPTLCPERPVTLKQGEIQSTVLTVGDDVMWGVDGGILPELRLRLQVQKLPAPDQLTVSLNGRTLENGVLEDGWVEYQPAAELLRIGANEVTMSTTAGGNEAPVVTDVQMQVRYKKAP
jgi:hypothetical protein